MLLGPLTIYALACFQLIITVSAYRWLGVDVRSRSRSTLSKVELSEIEVKAAKMQELLRRPTIKAVDY
ncbi:hypothetical protein ACE3MQ_15085 [Paenibacillus lentus]